MFGCSPQGIKTMYAHQNLSMSFFKMPFLIIYFKVPYFYRTAQIMKMFGCYPQGIKKCMHTKTFQCHSKCFSLFTKVPYFYRMAQILKMFRCSPQGIKTMYAHQNLSMSFFKMFLIIYFKVPYFYRMAQIL